MMPDFKKFSINSLSMSRRVDIWELFSLLNNCATSRLSRYLSPVLILLPRQTSNASSDHPASICELDLGDQRGTDDDNPVFLIDGEFHSVTGSTLGALSTNAITRFREAVDSGPWPRIPHSPANACAGNDARQPHGERSIRLAGGLERRPAKNLGPRGLLTKAPSLPAYRAVALQPVGVCVHLLFIEAPKMGVLLGISFALLRC
jgi:hypothetical protein